MGIYTKHLSPSLDLESGADGIKKLNPHHHRL